MESVSVERLDHLGVVAAVIKDLCLIAMIDAATFVAVNDYEGRLLAERTGLSLEAIAQRVDALIVTLGRADSVVAGISVEAWEGEDSAEPG